ncbi:MAG: ABC transporter permease [Candidatus Cloacimonetes bacterium]|nr:ABC transporter permease [Candidatus Cloacimonadota bacterium]
MLGYLLRPLSELGEYLLMMRAALVASLKTIKRKYEILKQMKKIGYDSLLLIFVTSGFTGLVTAVQATYQTSNYIPKSLIGVLVGKSTMIELAPVLTALVLSGKVGASIAAEIGTMKVSEQIDALETLAVDPVEYLYYPRILAGILMFPALTIFSNVIAILSAFFLSTFRYKLSFYSFFSNMKNYFQPYDLWGGLVKAFFFGFVVTSIACFIGSKTKGGAEGVGKSATQSVVYSSISILVMDFAVAYFLFGNR